MTNTNAKPVTWKGIVGVKVLTTYVDPHPGKHGSDRITFKVSCDRCGGDGIFRWWTSYGQAAGTCFKCFGSGKYAYDRAVSSIRKDAKADAYAKENAAEIRAYWDELNAAQQAQQAADEFNRAWDDAHKEQARRAAMVQGFIAEVGEKVAGLEGEVTFRKLFEGEGWNSYDSIVVIIKLDNGQVVKTSGTGQLLWDIKKGDRVRFGGTVKAHKSYKGQDQTILTRVKGEIIAKAAA